MTASRYDLLPPNATQLERDFSRAIDCLRTNQLQDTQTAYWLPSVFGIGIDATPELKLGGASPIIRTAKRTNIPDGVVPWLIYEYGLGEILPYLGNNQRRAIAEGVLWQRIRGTADAVRIALSWVGVTGLVEESESGTYRWAEYQLGLSAGTTGDQIISDIVGVTRISSPVRSRLQRIYAVYDFRRFVLDSSLLSDGGMLSDHSGVRPNPDWPQISYGQIHSSLVEENITVSSAHTDVVGVLAEMSDRFILSRNKLDEDWHTVNHPALLTTQEGLSARYYGQTWTTIQWQPAAWGDVNVIASSSVSEEVSTSAVLFLPALMAIAVDSSQV